MQTSLSLILPEIVLTGVALFILLIDAHGKTQTRRPTFVLSACTPLVLAAIIALQWNAGLQGSSFGGLYVADPLAHFLKIISCIAVSATLVYGRSYVEARDMVSRGGEYYTLALLALLGQMVMISAGSMLSIYLGLELMSLALYALIALRRDDVNATEAAMKYFVLGSLASGVLLYGMSMIYGATGHLVLSDIAAAIRADQVQHLPLVFGVVFIVSGLAFKLSAAPFHMWAPDVYQGSPTAVTLVVGGAPKLASFVIALRLLTEGLHGIALDWQPMLLLMALASLAIGNIAAIAQSNFKRMLAYSTVSHMGFVFLGLLSGIVENHPDAASAAYGASLYYMVVYVLTTLSTFGLILLASRKGFECEHIADLKGLNRRSPMLSGILLLSMFSLAGIPPLPGFYAKLYVLQALIGADHLWIAVIAVLFSLIGAFYYLRVVKVAYFDEPQDQPSQTSATDDCAATGVMALNGLAIVALGLLPGGLMALCIRLVQVSAGS